MKKKKRMVLILVLIALVALGYTVSWELAGLLLLALVVMLGGLQLVHIAMAHRGLQQLRARQEQFGVPAMAAAAKQRAPQEDALRFVVLGDTRNDLKITAEVYARAAEEQPAMIFHTGDIVRHGTAGEFLKNHIGMLRYVGEIPMFCVPGNHERGARRDFAAFKALYGDDRFSFQVGPCHFIGFNNSNKKRVGDAELRYVEEELEKAAAPLRFLFYHIPPDFFEARFVNDDKRRGFSENAQALHDLCVRHKVNEVFMAHIHGYATAEIDGVRYTLTAGGGAPLSSRLVKPENSVYHFVRCDVRDGQYTRTIFRKTEAGWQESEE